MQTEYLRCLVALAEHGSMNKAAKALFCTQPAVTNAIKAIEQELGHPVIERQQNGVILTPLGQVVLQDSRLILGYLDTWREMAKESSANQPVIINLTGTAPRFFLVNSILQMRNRHPDLNISIRYGVSHSNQLRLSDESRYRIGISYQVPAHLPAARDFALKHGLRIALLQHDEFWLFLNRKNELANPERTILLEDLRGKKMMLYQEPSGFPYIDKLRSVNCQLGPQMWQEENLMIALTLDETALSLRPHNTADHNPYFTDGNICRKPILDCPMPVYLCILYPSLERITASETLFVSELKTFFPEFRPLSQESL